MNGEYFMYELIQVSENCFYVDCPAKIGVVKVSESDAVLIDSGSGKDAAKKVKRILDEQKLSLKAIYNTHSHADHIGGNKYLQDLTGCKIFSPGIERAFTEFPILEPTYLYGGNALSELHGKFLLAKESEVLPLTPDSLPDGFEIIPLPGHSFDMVGFRTAENVIYLADCLASEQTLEKYKISFLYDVKSYLETLEKVKNMTAKCFVPSHAEPSCDISALAQLNIDKTLEIADKITALCANPISFEALLSALFSEYSLEMTLEQRMLVGSTVKCYLSYLAECKKVSFFFENGVMLWKKS